LRDLLDQSQVLPGKPYFGSPYFAFDGSESQELDLRFEATDISAPVIGPAKLEHRRLPRRLGAFLPVVRSMAL
jgi:hypothetical protein